MPQPPEPQRREPSQSIPRTLSLPVIPATPPTGKGRSTGSQENRPRSTSGVSRPVRPDTYADHQWDAETSDTTGEPYGDVAASTRMPTIPTTSQLQVISQKLIIARAQQNSQAVAPYFARSQKQALPQRSFKRTLIWQGLLLAVMVVTFLSTLKTTDGETNGALANAFQASTSAKKETKITAKVPTFIQIDPTIGYLSTDQYSRYNRADCSAAATDEVLTAWGDPNGNIGHVIEDMGSGLDAGSGLVSTSAFTNVAAKHNFNVIVTNNITIDQLRQIVGVQNIPVVIGVRDTLGGYYRYFAPGHFLVVTGADANGFQIVDSSTYFVHYLPTDTFLSLWATPKAAIFTPNGLAFQLP